MRETETINYGEVHIKNDEINDDAAQRGRKYDIKKNFKEYLLNVIKKDNLKRENDKIKCGRP